MLKATSMRGPPMTPLIPAKAGTQAGGWCEDASLAWPMRAAAGGKFNTEVTEETRRTRRRGCAADNPMRLLFALVGAGARLAPLRPPCKAAQRRSVFSV